MADDAKKEEAEPKKKGGLMIVIVGVIAIAAGLGGGFFMGKGSAPKAPEGHDPTATPIKYEVGDLYVNIAETKATRVLKLTPWLELSETKLASDLTEFEPVIRDLVSEAASRMTIDELEGRNGRAILKREIKDRINVLIRERMAGAVIDVYFSDFLIQ